MVRGPFCSFLNHRTVIEGIKKWIFMRQDPVCCSRLNDRLADQREGLCYNGWDWCFHERKGIATRGKRDNRYRSVHRWHSSSRAMGRVQGGKEGGRGRSERKRERKRERWSRAWREALKVCSVLVRCVARSPTASPLTPPPLNVRLMLSPQARDDGLVTVDMGPPELNGPKVPTTLPTNQDGIVLNEPIQVSGAPGRAS